MENFSNYIIDVEKGTVFSKKRNRYVGYKYKKGYVGVGLMGDDGKQYHYRLHRLIWENVNGKIPQGYEIDHINTVRDDNRISNLRCVTPKENSNNPLTLKNLSEAMKGKTLSDLTKKKMSEAKLGENNPFFGKLGEKHPRSKAVAKLDIDTLEVLEILPCTMEFQRKYGYNYTNISKCCNEKLKTAYGFKWQYV